MSRWYAVDLDDTVRTLPKLREMVWVYLPGSAAVKTATTDEFHVGEAGATQSVWWTCERLIKIPVHVITHWHPMTGEFETLPPRPPASISFQERGL
jgi:hypothetical protein